MGRDGAAAGAAAEDLAVVGAGAALAGGADSEASAAVRPEAAGRVEAGEVEHSCVPLIFLGLISFGTSHTPASVFIVLGAVTAVVSAVLYFGVEIGSEHDFGYGDPSTHSYGGSGGTCGSGFGPFGGWTHL